MDVRYFTSILIAGLTVFLLFGWSACSQDEAAYEREGYGVKEDSLNEETIEDQQQGVDRKADEGVREYYREEGGELGGKREMDDEGYGNAAEEVEPGRGNDRW